MNDITDTDARTSQDMRIDMRILKHLLQEATDLLEEAQTHALVETPCETTSYVLAQANWRMTATCIWAINECFPAPGAPDQTAQLHAPAPIFSRSDARISTQLAAFILRVDRLHERARRLDDLSRGPMVSSASQGRIEPEQKDEPRGSATIIPLFGSDCATDTSANLIEQTQSVARRAMGGLD